AVHQVDQVDLRAGLGKTVGRFQSQQAAADHHHTLLTDCERQQEIDIAAVAEGVDAGKIGAWYVESQRRRAGGKDQLRKRNALFIFDLELAAAEIDLGSPAVIFQRHATVAPPVSRLELDVMGSSLAGKHRRQQ